MKLALAAFFLLFPSLAFAQCLPINRVIEFDTQQLQQDHAVVAIERDMKGLQAANYIGDLLRVITPHGSEPPDTPKFDEVIVLTALPLPGKKVVLLLYGCVTGMKGFPAEILAKVEAGA